MRKICFLFFFIGMFFLGCSKSGDCSYIPETVISDNNLNEDCETIIPSVQNTDDSKDNAIKNETEDLETDFISSYDGKISFADYMLDTNLDYYGEIICFTKENNIYTDIFESQYDKFSLVFDLDNDGIKEAFVCDAIEYDDDSILINSLYFIDEQMNLNTVMKGYYIDFNIEQYLIKNDLYSYITLNGYEGMEPICHISSYVNDDWVIVTDELLENGHKYFVSVDELLWVRTGYMNCYDIDEDTGEGFWNGRSFIPYFYKIENNELFLNTAEEKNINEINEIAVFNIDDYTDAESVQFLLRENGELEVNYVKSNIFGYDFYSDIYFIEDNVWVYKYSVDGYYVPDPVNYRETDWDFINEL